MDDGLNAILSGFLAFVVATIAVTLCDTGRSRIDVLTIGGVTGGAVALAVWLAGRRRSRHSVREVL